MPTAVWDPWTAGPGSTVSRYDKRLRALVALDLVCHADRELSAVEQQMVAQLLETLQPERIIAAVAAATDTAVDIDAVLADVSGVTPGVDTDNSVSNDADPASGPDVRPEWEVTDEQ